MEQISSLIRTPLSLAHRHVALAIPVVSGLGCLGWSAIKLSDYEWKAQGIRGLKERDRVRQVAWAAIGTALVSLGAFLRWRDLI